MNFSLNPESAELDYPGRLVKDNKIPANLRCFGVAGAAMRESIRRSNEETENMMNRSIINTRDALPPQ